MLDDILLDAKIGMSIAQIAARLRIPTDEFFSHYYSTELSVRRYYDAGVLQGSVEIDNELYKLAKNGSLSATEIYNEKKIEAKLSNVFYEILNS